MKMPAGTRVVYGGVRSKGVKGRENWEKMIMDALNNSVNDKPLRTKLKELKEKVCPFPQGDAQ